MTELLPILDGRYAAANTLSKKLADNTGNVVWQWISDSSSGVDQASCWGPRLIAAVAAQYPAYTVTRYDWTLSWSSGTAYAVGAIVYSAGNIYTCTGAGTAGATEPTGTGTGISDGGATWAYVSAASVGQYRRPVNVQTGTGSNTLSVYLGAAPGFTIQYCLTNWAAMVQGIPDLWTINHGYNQSEGPSWTPAGGGYSGAWYALLLAVLRRCRAVAPRADVIMCAQPPKRVASSVIAADVTAQAARSQAVAVFAAQEGCALIDAYSAFVNAGVALSTLVSTDGIHPTTAGYDLWLSAAKALFPASGAARALVPARARDRIVIPAAAFGTIQGTIADSYAGQDQYNNRYGHVKSMPNGAVSALSTLIEIPTWWEFLNVTVLWSAAVTTGQVVAQMQTALVNTASTAQFPASGSKQMAGLQSTGLNTGGNFYLAVPAAKAITPSLMVAGYPLSGLQGGPDDVLQLTFARNGTNGSDTAAGALEFHGVILDRLR